MKENTLGLNNIAWSLGIFLLSIAASEIYSRIFPAHISIHEAATVLSEHLLLHGWKPITVETEHGLQLDASLFATGLVSATAYVVVKKDDEHFIALNIQKRNVDGIQQDVVDVPCGFYNAGDPVRLARTQHVLAARQQLPSEERTPDGIAQLLAKFNHERHTHNINLEDPKIDLTAEEDKGLEALMPTFNKG